MLLEQRQSMTALFILVTQSARSGTIFLTQMLQQ
jgi:hypothetical protein